MKMTPRDPFERPMNWAKALPSSAYSRAISSSAEIDAAAIQLGRIREDYHADGTALAGARYRIIQSWNRCRQLGVDPDKKEATVYFDVDALRVANEELLRVAEPVLERLTQVLADTGYVVVLTDPHGLLMTISGDRAARVRVAGLGFAPGADCSEASAGTNAIGTAIADRRPLQLLAGEHFCEAGQRVTCTAAPIYRPKTRDIAAVLDITGHYRLVRSHLIDIVTLGALEIEEKLVLAH
jgi:sigma-54 dependent transcriptional regulator, acetoin dehydrogenase operon transcriptional activator AcoR